MRSVLSSAQLELAKVAGVNTNAETKYIDGAAGESIVIWDSLKATRQPVLIRITNLSTETLYVSEDIRGAGLAPIGGSAANPPTFSHVIPGSIGSGMEWQKHRPGCLAISSAGNPYSAMVVFRYLDEN